MPSGTRRRKKDYDNNNDLNKMGNRMSYVGLWALAALTACQPKSKQDSDMVAVEETPVEITVSGTIAEASMNTLTLVTEMGDTLTFNTLDAEQEGTMLAGDNAEVTYEDTNENRERMSPVVSWVITSPSPARLMGSWVEPTIIGDLPYQGIRLEENGVAHSINMETLSYESWFVLRGLLILNYTSEGSGQIISCVDTFRIVTLTQDSLILENDDFSMRYGRLKETAR